MSKKTKTKTSKIESNVMDKIKKGEVKMKPQSYYLLIGFLSAMTVLLLSFIASYFMSVITLWFRLLASQGPAYGVRNNLSSLIGDFPWFYLIVGILLLAFIIFVIKKVGALYKIRLIYLIPSMVILFLLMGFLLSYSSLPGMFGGRHQNTNCQKDGSNCRPSNVRYYRR